MASMIHSANLCSQCQTQIFAPHSTPELNSKLRSPAAPEPCEVGQLRSLSSPVRKLPNEILSRVFEFACDKNTFQDGPEVDEDEQKLNLPSKRAVSSSLRSLPSLSLSSVCFLWRVLAQSLPGLWSCLRIEVFTSDRETVSKGFISTLQYYLEKSRSHPLLLELSIMKEHNGDPVDATIFTLLLQHAQRWKSLFSLGFTKLSDYIPSSGITQFPCLEHLCAFSTSDIACFKSVPKLHSLQTWFISALHSDLPSDQLTTLRVRCPARSKMDKVFLLCPNVVNLVLTESAKQGHLRSLPTAQASSNKLQSLSLVCDIYDKDADLFESVLTAYTFPSLTEFEISIQLPGYIWPRKAFSDFLSRSSCRITSFTSNTMGYSDLDVIYIFHHLPFLENLTLSDGWLKPEEGQYSITPRLISHLHGCDTDGQGSLSSPLLPKLRHLSLTVESQTFDDEALVKMVSSRWLSDLEDVAARTDCLRSFVLRFHHRAVDETVYRPLFCLEDMGMQVVITGEK